jgi:hypothetical protein
MICDVCSSLPLTNPADRWCVQHYSTFAELTKSAQNGCEICALLRTVLLDYYAQGLCGSVEEAESYHRQLDQNLERKINECFDSEENAPTCHRSDYSAFFVEAVLEKESEPRHQGLRGLLYLRLSDESLDPMNGIYPFIQVSSPPGMHIPYSG